MNKFRALLTAGFCLLVLTACGGASLPEKIEKTTIAIDAKGAVTTYLVESFDKDYYDISELTSMAVEDAAAFNTEAKSGEGVPVTVEKVELLENGTDARITYRFDTAESYSEYMEGTLFYGTVSEALLAGYHLQAAALSSIKDGTLVTDAWLKEEASQRHILITNQTADFYLPYAVTHISSDAVYEEDGSVSNPQSEGNIYVLLKK